MNYFLKDHLFNFLKIKFLILTLRKNILLFSCVYIKINYL